MVQALNNVSPLALLSPMDKVIAVSVVAQKSPSDSRAASGMLSRVFQVAVHFLYYPSMLCVFGSGGGGVGRTMKKMRSRGLEVRRCGVGFDPVQPFSDSLAHSAFLCSPVFSGGSRVCVMLVPAWSCFFSENGSAFCFLRFIRHNRNAVSVVRSIYVSEIHHEQHCQQSFQLRHRRSLVYLLFVVFCLPDDNDQQWLMNFNINHSLTFPGRRRCSSWYA